MAASPLKNYQAGYNPTQNNIYLNTQATDLSQGGQIMAAVYHEAQRKENHDNPFVRPLSDQQQTNLARLRGDRAQKLWHRLTDSRPTPNPTATHAWNRQHQATLAHSNTRVAQARHQDVKPRVLEKLDPRYWQAKASGDEEKAQKIQAGWEKVKPWVLVLGTGVAAFEDVEKGQYVKATLKTGLAATEAIGLGALKKLVTTGAKAGLKQVGKKVATKGLGNPFKEFTLKEIQKGFEKQVQRGKMSKIGPNPTKGKGAYVNKKSGYSYHLDKGNNYGRGGKIIERPHIDVNHPNPKPKNIPPKKKLPIKGK